MHFFPLAPLPLLSRHFRGRLTKKNEANGMGGRQTFGTLLALELAWALSGRKLSAGIGSCCWHSLSHMISFHLHFSPIILDSGKFIFFVKFFCQEFSYHKSVSQINSGFKAL
jgi:hypothetical protein